MLQVQHLSFGYTTNPILKDISFSAQAGDYIAVIGESGSGKSTLLKLIYGEYDLDSGNLSWNNEAILGPKYNLVVGTDFMKYVAQEFELMPFISVEENIGKFLSNFFPDEKKERTAALLEVVELTAFAKTKVKLLSGGQKQRVALARALAKAPEIILLDEPFSHIDNFKKQSLRRNVFEYLKKQNITCIVATHDKEDVLGFADRILVLDHAKIIADNTPENLYKAPETALIASFFSEFSVINETFIYAHQLHVVAHSPLKAIITNSYFKGAYYLHRADINGNSVLFEHPSSITIGESVCLQITKPE
ncbi:ABC transporter ATP-binding protein [Bizionia saleffrena]|uniref:ABC transporter ATP-binding protein n=1 Tax=Bizionia saleffrena TaxID=291189 RepID=A0A8H2LD05_9FLAO|nr:ABC transporter ATP-binding protein [Bizionia saleffrena]TYB74126.1 ABC transporter ATP-binding protein [Bizionia saleffrena]